MISHKILVDPLSRQSLLNLREYQVCIWRIGFAMEQASEQDLRNENRGNRTSQIRWMLWNIFSANSKLSKVIDCLSYSTSDAPFALHELS